jgi:hypothetical protein
MTMNVQNAAGVLEDARVVAQAERVGEDGGRGGRAGREQTPAARLSRELVPDEAIDGLLARAGDGQVRLTGQGGFLPELIARVLERGMGAELSEHLGYDRGDPAGRGSGNSRNGSTPKTLATEVGDVPVNTPRDRAGTFEPRLVAKGTRAIVPHRRRPGQDLPAWKHEHNRSHRQVRARVEHAFARMKTWAILRDCRLRGDGVAHAIAGIAHLHNLKYAA